MIKSPQKSFLEFLPVSLFGAVMGLCGLCFAWRIAAKMWELSSAISEAIGALVLLSFTVLTFAYLAKFIKYKSIVIAEIKDPVGVCFFATFIVCLLLLPGVLLPYMPSAAKMIWYIGAITMLGFAWHVLRQWINHQQEPGNAMPAWILPVVGTLDIPIVGNQLNLTGAHEISVAAFGIGLIFSIILLTLIFSRLLFQPQLPKAAQATLLILLGPAALAFTSYHGLTGQTDLVSAVFLYFNVFLLLLIGSKIILIPVSCPFRVSWWSVSFPLSAITVSALIYAQYKPDWLHLLLAVSLLIITSIVILYLFIITIFQIINGVFMS